MQTERTYRSSGEAEAVRHSNEAPASGQKAIFQGSLKRCGVVAVLAVAAAVVLKGQFVANTAAGSLL